MLKRYKWLAPAALLVLICGAALWALPQDQSPPPEPSSNRASLGLMTSLPIYWNEAGSVADLLAPPDQGSPRHWVREELERNYVLVPLDTLWSGAVGETDRSYVASQFNQLELLLLAQPYTLTPQDNVALDAWVRGGGRLLMFADPVLTEHSEFALGDRRRPQEIGLVPPIFARWGLSQSFDETQSQEGGTVDWEGTDVPVNQRGRFAQAEKTSSSNGDCRILGDGLLAKCRIERGSALLIADAALLENVPTPERQAALKRLMEEALGKPAP